MLLNKKALVSLCVAAGLSLTGVTAVAAQNAQITVTGQIAAATCDLNVTNTNIDLGSHISSSVTQVGVIANSEYDFQLGLSNCSQDFTAAPSKNIQLFAKGSSLTTDASLFSTAANGTVGVQLKAENKKVNPNTNFDLASITEIKTTGTATIPMNVALYSTVATPKSQHIQAPITFSVSYE
ncbi:fimbrial protein [Providencia rettgeri]|uniref:fimbrial protein n=1 Tax=Providencia rettgeri TaxID=587 RepID=UPI00236284DD|nr:fimbrial protein [Providencia rettgeri]